MSLLDNRFSIYTINSNYLNYLHQYDDRVPTEHDETFAKKRPFIGIIVVVDGLNYVLPLTSPKKKHLTMRNALDFQKIDNGNLGAINLNNMFPITNMPLTHEMIDISNDSELNNSQRDYTKLIKEQLIWLNRTENRDKILAKAISLRRSYINNTLPTKIRNRCCNFALLEEKCNEYIPK